MNMSRGQDHEAEADKLLGSIAKIQGREIGGIIWGRLNFMNKYLLNKSNSYRNCSITPAAANFCEAKI